MHSRYLPLLSIGLFIIHVTWMILLAIGIAGAGPVLGLGTFASGIVLMVALLLLARPADQGVMVEKVA